MIPKGNQSSFYKYGMMDLKYSPQNVESDFATMRVPPKTKYI
jgi:hypothetical protein